MRELKINQLKTELKNFQLELEKLEKEISVLSYGVVEEKKIKKLARMICVEELKDDMRKIDETN